MKTLEASLIRGVRAIDFVKPDAIGSIKFVDKFITDQISEDIYQKHSEKIRTEIAALSKETDISQIEGSNLELAVSKCLTIAQNLSQAWLSAECENKQRLQKLVFPDGILYVSKKGWFEFRE
ncbi:MAG: hypothetical protein ACKO33_08110 [Bacteroidota bacterium]